MTCSADYMALVRTVSGLTPENPYTTESFFGIKLEIANPQAYGEWRQLARVLSEKTYERLVQLGEVETSKIQKGSQTGYPQWNAHVEEVNRLYNEAHELPDGFGAAVDTKWWSENIAGAEQVAIDSACELERLDYAILEYGVSPPGLPAVGGAKPQPGKMGILGTALTLVGVAAAGVAVVYVIRASRKSTPAPAPASEAA